MLSLFSEWLKNISLNFIMEHLLLGSVGKTQIENELNQTLKLIQTK